MNEGAYPAEFAGAKTAPVEGRSLLPVLLGGKREPSPQLCWEWSGNCAIRQGKWKLVYDTRNKARQWELYDLEADRTELCDLASAEPERVAAMRAAYETWATATDRNIPGRPKPPGEPKTQRKSAAG